MKDEDNQEREYTYFDQPYVPMLAEFAAANPPAKPGVEFVIIEHSDFCPRLHGTSKGFCCCNPIVRKPTRNERRILKRKSKH